MRILVLSNGWTTKISGGDEHILQVTKYWSKSHDVAFILPSLGYQYSRQLLHSKVKVHVYNTPLEKPLRGTFRILILYFLRVLRLLLFFPKRYYDVIVASSHYPYDVIPAILLKIRFSHSKVVVYFHSLDIPHYGFGLSRIVSVVANFFGGLLAKLFADLVFTVNTNTTNFLLSLGIRGERVFLTSNGITIDNINFMHNKRRKKFDGCFVGRHVKHKGLYDLLKVWEVVCKFKPNAKLAICGYGEETPKIAEHIREKKMERNIILLGFVQENEKYKVLYSSRVFIFPSYLEGWGIAIAEAMSCGLPVVAYKLPVYQEVFKDKLITVRLGDIDAMAKHVIFLLKNPKIANKIGEEGRTFIKRYEWKKIAIRELNYILGREK